MNARGFQHSVTVCASLPVKRLLSLLLALTCLALSGCGPRRVRADFTNYEKSYAVTSNREVLLNLARLEGRDPTYFFKLGQISSQYRMQAALPTTGSYLPTGSAGTNELPGGSGAPSLIYENDPSFQFIPVNDETNTRLLLSPVPSDVFYDLYYQGWRVDQLFRLMVDRIEITLPAENGNGCTVHIIRNAPPPVFKGSSSPIDYGHEQPSIASYVNFLRISAVVYALQKYGLLQLRGTTEFEPLDKDSWLPAEGAPSAANANRSPVTGAAGPGESPGQKLSGAGPTAKEFDETAAKSEFWEMRKVTQGDKQVNAWVLGRMRHRTQFQLTSSTGEQGKNIEGFYGANVREIESKLRTIFATDESLKELGAAPELTDILEILNNGFSIEGASTDQDNPQSYCPTEWSQGAPSRLVLRSLIGVMASAAQEQDSFEQLQADDPQILLTGEQLTASREALQQGLTKPAPQESSVLALVTREIHTGLVGLTKQQAAEKQEQLPEGFDETFNRAYGIQALNFLEAAQNNSGELGTFKGLIPTIERLPLLQLDWSQKELNKNRLPPLAKTADLKALGFAVNYDNRDFLVTDADLSSVDWLRCGANSAAKDLTCYAKENQYWNRDMFRLISELSSQVTVDISKFPLPAVLQLRTD